VDVIDGAASVSAPITCAPFHDQWFVKLDKNGDLSIKVPFYHTKDEKEDKNGYKWSEREQKLVMPAAERGGVTSLTFGTLDSSWMPKVEFFEDEDDVSLNGALLSDLAILPRPSEYSTKEYVLRKFRFTHPTDRVLFKSSHVIQSVSQGNDNASNGKFYGFFGGDISNLAFGIYMSNNGKIEITDNLNSGNKIEYECIDSESYTAFESLWNYPTRDNSKPSWTKDAVRDQIKDIIQQAGGFKKWFANAPTLGGVTGIKTEWKKTGYVYVPKDLKCDDPSAVKDYVNRLINVMKKHTPTNEDIELDGHLYCQTPYIINIGGAIMGTRMGSGMWNIKIS
jgi:hypothetical protein